MSVAVLESPTLSATRDGRRPKYSIIVPAYNESRRILTALQEIVDHVQQERWDAEILAVDDGSSDDTAEIIRHFAARHREVRLISNPGNQGKGYAVRNGMMNARGEFRLFTDADLSAPIAEASRLFGRLEDGADVAIGSRWLDPSLQFVRQPLRRRVFSRSFNIYIKIMLGLPFRDTQCGFKAFTRSAAEIIFPLQRITRWGFDPEIIYIAFKHGLRVVEVAVAWGHDERSTINPVRDGFRMGIEVMKIRWYAWTGKYRA